MDRARATRLLIGLLALAFAVSVVHYVDNYVNYDDYPQGGIIRGHQLDHPDRLQSG